MVKYGKKLQHKNDKTNGCALCNGKVNPTAMRRTSIYHKNFNL